MSVEIDGKWSETGRSPGETKPLSGTQGRGARSRPKGPRTPLSPAGAMHGRVTATRPTTEAQLSPGAAMPGRCVWLAASCLVVSLLAPLAVACVPPAPSLRALYHPATFHGARVAAAAVPYPPAPRGSPSYTVVGASRRALWPGTTGRDIGRTPALVPSMPPVGASGLRAVFQAWVCAFMSVGTVGLLAAMMQSQRASPGAPGHSVALLTATGENKGMQEGPGACVNFHSDRRGDPPPWTPSPPPPFGTGLVCTAVQQGKTMHRESCGDGHMPVTRGYMRALYPLLYGPPPSAEVQLKTCVLGTFLVTEKQNLSAFGECHTLVVAYASAPWSEYDASAVAAESPRRELVRSSAGAGVVYPLF